MSQHPLRLVVDQYDDTAPAAIELQPAAGAALHIHLHMSSRHGSISPPAVELAPESKARGRSGRGVIRPLLVGVAGVLIAVVAFDLGGRSAEGHAQALAAGRARAEGLASLAAPPPLQPAQAAPVDPLASVQQELGRRPTVTPSPGAAPSSGGSDLFGLQR
ncbi:hypothetical protein [Acidisoma sp. S159]|uniref:hypothetical protein n=1 Tax=Acidisoma sp. S159 TaxID=1747225 RepID=UPI00131D4A68|nr:hypothetical protein [Acidisoma sp. S159]